MAPAVQIEGLILPNEIKLNNSRILKKRTQHFNTSLVKNLEIISFVAILMGYLTTLSLVDFLIRLSQQLVIARPFPKTSSEMRMISTNVKQLISRSIFQVLIAVNVGIIMIHLFYSINVTDNVNEFEYSHGGWTLQVIGESKFRSWLFYKLFILGNDLLIFVVQLTMCFITCLKNEGLVEETVAEEVIEDQDTEDVYDGYSGNVTVVELNPKALLNQVAHFRRQQEPENTNPGDTTANRDASGNLNMPGGFQMFSNFTVNDLV